MFERGVRARSARILIMSSNTSSIVAKLTSPRTTLIMSLKHHKIIMNTLISCARTQTQVLKTSERVADIGIRWNRNATHTSGDLTSHTDEYQNAGTSRLHPQHCEDTHTTTKTKSSTKTKPPPRPILRHEK